MIEEKYSTDWPGIIRKDTSIDGGMTFYDRETSTFTWKDPLGKVTKTNFGFHKIEEYPMEDPKEEDIDESTQEKIDKIGVAGKRNIDDLLEAFQSIKLTREEKKTLVVDDLGNRTFLEDIFHNPETDGKTPKYIVGVDPF